MTWYRTCACANDHSKVLRTAAAADCLSGGVLVYVEAEMTTKTAPATNCLVIYERNSTQAVASTRFIGYATELQFYGSFNMRGVNNNIYECVWLVWRGRQNRYPRKQASQSIITKSPPFGIYNIILQTHRCVANLSIIYWYMRGHVSWATYTATREANWGHTFWTAVLQAKAQTLHRSMIKGEGWCALRLVLEFNVTTLSIDWHTNTRISDITRPLATCGVFRRVRQTGFKLKCSDPCLTRRT